MKSPTFWLILLGALFAWRVLDGINDSAGGGSGGLASGGAFGTAIAGSQPVLVSFSAEW